MSLEVYSIPLEIIQQFSCSVFLYRDNSSQQLSVEEFHWRKFVLLLRSYCCSENYLLRRIVLLLVYFLLVKMLPQTC